MNQSNPAKKRSNLLSRAVGIGDKPIGFKVVRGVVSSVARKLILAPVAILLVPFTLWKIGVQNYGIWAVLATIINLAWLMDPGLSPTVTKFVAESSRTEDVGEIRRVLNASLALSVMMAIFASCLVGVFSHFLISQFFRGADAPPTSAILSLWPLLILCMAAFVVAMPFLSLINGRQRMDLTNLLVFGAELFGSIMTVIMLLAGTGVRGLLIARLLTSLFILIGSIAIGKRLFPAIMPNPFRCEFATMKKIMSFSVPLYAGYVMSTLQGQLERLYLARFVGIVPVGWYSVASEGAVKVKRIPDLLLGPILAAASELESRKEQKKLEELHFRAHKYLALLTVPLTVFAVVDAKALIRLWVGGALHVVALAFAVLIIGNLFSQIMMPTYFIVVGKGVLRPGVYAAVIACALNPILSYIFITRWGFSGAALGTTLPMVVSTVYFFLACRQYFLDPIFRTLRRAYLRPLLCSLVAALPIPALLYFRVSTWIGVGAAVVSFAVLYVVGILLTGCLDRKDISMIADHLPFLSRWRVEIEPSEMGDLV